MPSISYARHQFPAALIRQAVWLYLRFTLSFRDIEDLLAERGIEVSYETVRRWVLKFGPAIARNLRRLRPRPSARWYLDEMVVRIAGKRMYLWRAVDDGMAHAIVRGKNGRRYEIEFDDNAMSLAIHLGEENVEIIAESLGDLMPREPCMVLLNLPRCVHRSAWTLSPSIE